MKKITQVTLLSLLVFPGLGHLVLKKYAVAIGFSASFGYLLLSLLNEIHDKTQQVLASVISGDIPIEAAAIRQALIDQGALENANLSTIGYLLVVIWAISAFDAYRIANKNLKQHLSDTTD